MTLFLDASVIIILAATCIIGYCRGFIRYIICMVGTIAAVIVSAAAANVLSAPVYERYVRQEITEEISAALEDTDVNRMVMNELENQGLGGYLSEEDIDKALSSGGDIAESISGMLSEKGADSQSVQKVKDKFSNYMDEVIPDKIRNEYIPNDFSKLIDRSAITDRELSECAEALCKGDNEQAASLLENTVARPVLTGILRVVLFCVCFAVIEILIKVILLISGVFTKLPEISAANRLGGLLLGAVKGCLYVALIAFMLCVVVNATANSMSVLNEEIVEKTYLFKYFFNFFYK